MTKYLALVALMIPLSACVEDNAGPSRPSVGNESNLLAFEGARAGQSEMGIQALGFQAARTEGLTTYWYNPASGACARIVTSDGRYASVDMVDAGNC